MGKMWDFECLLGEALAADREPEEECNQKILEQWEKKTMSRTIQESLSGKTFAENLKKVCWFMLPMQENPRRK